LIPTPPDPFEEWLHAPLGADCPDPRFEVRRLVPDDFERVYDCVDAAFGRKRPRPLYEWLYRRNPMGTARCWGMLERSSGELVKTSAAFPWPIWRGDTPLRGSLGGDAATVPAWQRQGLSAIRRPVTRSHPWYGKTCGIAGPNEGSRAVARSAGNPQNLLGDLPGGVALLRPAPLLERARLPRAIARPLGAPAAAVLAAWRRLALRSGRGLATRVEPVTRFSTDFDEVTERHMAWPGFWCPHNAAFLNWRYLEHPVERYEALALVEAERPVAYAVVRLAGTRATLAELAAPTRPSAPAARLLGACMDLAEEAGCELMSFFSTPAWRHWGLLRRAGFLPYRTSNHFEASCRELEPEVNELGRWQITPGDRDYH